MIDILNEIILSAMRNKLRTALTGFAVAWGIFMLIFLLGAGNGLINASEQNNARFMDRSMVIFGGTTSKPYNGYQEGRNIPLHEADVKSTQQLYPANVDSVASKVSNGNIQISNGQEYITANVSGVSPLEQQINNREMLQGRFINDIDYENRRKVLVLAQDQVTDLGETPASVIGKHIKVDNFSFTVVGVYKKVGNESNPSAFIPFTTFKTIYSNGDEVDQIYFTFHGLSTTDENKSFEDNYRKHFNATHNAAPDDEDAVWIWNRFTQSMQMNNGIGMIRISLWIVGIFTLLSGIVGVSNIMLITVKERTHEFGIRKAIGATPWSLLRLIIIESVIITTFFGYIGMMAGMGVNKYMDATIGNKTVDTGVFSVAMFKNPTVGFGVCIEATLVMIISGTIAGLIPARKAAAIRPIEALRAE